MFVLCPHCQFLVALDAATGRPPAQCPRCGKALQPEAAAAPVDAAPAPIAPIAAAPADARPEVATRPVRDSLPPQTAAETVPMGPEPAAATGRPTPEPVPPVAPPTTTPEPVAAVDSAPPAEAAATPEPRPAPQTDASAGPDGATTAAAPDPVTPTPRRTRHAATVPAAGDEQAAKRPRRTRPHPAPATTDDARAAAASAGDAAESAAAIASRDAVADDGAAGIPAAADVIAEAAHGPVPVEAELALEATPHADAGDAAAPDIDAPEAGAAVDDGPMPRPRAPSFARIPRAARATPRRRLLRALAIAGLALLLVVQALLADRAQLAAEARWRPLLSALCAPLRCALPPWREPAAFTVLARDVRPHPDRPGVLRATATFRNDARWPQPWPALVLTLSDLDGQTAGARVFAPREYLGAAPRGELASGQSASVALDIVEPTSHVVAFTFDFR